MHNIIKALLLSGIMATVPAYSQSTTGEDGADEKTSQAINSRPEMPNLFFRKEQRRVLEAVRQGVVQENDFDIEEFVPVVILEDVLPEETEIALIEEVRPQRANDFYIDAYIANRSNGKKVLWLNGNSFRLDNDAGYLSRLGLEVGESKKQQVDDIQNGIFSADDVYNESGIQAKVGQVINIDGTVEETLPVIRIKKNN